MSFYQSMEINDVITGLLLLKGQGRGGGARVFLWATDASQAEKSPGREGD